MKILEKLLKTYTYQQLADILGYKSRSTVCNWVNKRKIPDRVMLRLKELSAQNKVQKLEE